MRNNILRIFKKVKSIDRLYLSQYSALTFRNLISKYEQYYSNEKDVLNKMSFKEIYASQTESVWSDKRPSKKKNRLEPFLKVPKIYFV